MLKGEVDFCWSFLNTAELGHFFKVRTLQALFNRRPKEGVELKHLRKQLEPGRFAAWEARFKAGSFCWERVQILARFLVCNEGGIEFVGSPNQSENVF